MNFCNHRTTVNCDRCRPPAPEQEGPRVELSPNSPDTHVWVSWGDSVMERVSMSKALNRTTAASQRKYLADRLPPEHDSHLPRLYRELGIAEGRPPRCGSTRTDPVDGRLFQCTMDRHDGRDHHDMLHDWTWRDEKPQPDPSIISTELGEFRVERDQCRREWHVVAPGPVNMTFRYDCSHDFIRGHLANMAPHLHRADAVRALAPVFQRLGIAEEPDNDTSRGVMLSDGTITLTCIVPTCHREQHKEALCFVCYSDMLARDAAAATLEATRERALKAGAHNPALKTLFLGEGPQTPPVECVHPACTPEEQEEHRTAAIKEKLFAKRSSKPSVGWQPYDDDGEG